MSMEQAKKPGVGAPLSALPAVLTTIGLMIGAGIWLLGADDLPITPAQASLAVAIVGVGFATIAALWWRSTASYPLAELAIAFHAITYGWVAFLKATNWRGVPEQAITGALSIALAGTALMWLGAGLGRRYRLVPDRLAHLRSVDVQGVALVLSVGNLIANLLPGFSRIPTLPHVTTTAAWAGLVLLYTSYLRNELPRPAAVALLGTVGLEILFRLAGGSLAQPALLMLVLGFVFWRERRAVPVRALILAVAILAVFNPVKGLWRKDIWWNAQQTASAVQKVERLIAVTVDYYSDPNRDPGDAQATNANRLGNISTLAWVMYVCPDRVSYWNGHTFTNLLYALVPRFLYPEKPQATGGNEFGRRYLLLAPDDFMTSFNLPWLVDFYVNFGIAGIAAGMLIAGFLLGALGNSFSGRISDVHFAIGVAATNQLFMAESNFSLMWGNVALDIIAVWGLFAWLGRRRSTIPGQT